MLKEKLYSFKIRIKPANLRRQLPSKLFTQELPEYETNYLPAPTIEAESEYFNKPIFITLNVDNEDIEIRYTVNGSIPSEIDSLYTKPFLIDKSTILNARCFKTGKVPGFTATKQLRYIQAKGIKYEFLPSSRYDGGHELALMDGKFGSEASIKENWIGFNGNDINVKIELVEAVNINKIMFNFMRWQQHWIFAPSLIELLVSEEGTNFTTVYKEKPLVDPSEKVLAKKVFKYEVELNKQLVKYIQLKATALDSCPDWHPGAGKDVWTFIDEITIE